VLWVAEPPTPVRFASAVPPEIETLHDTPSFRVWHVEPKALLGRVPSEYERLEAALRREELRAVGRAAASLEGGGPGAVDPLREQLVRELEESARSTAAAGADAARALMAEMAEARAERERQLAERQRRAAEAAATAEGIARAATEARAAEQAEAKARADAAAAAEGEGEKGTGAAAGVPAADGGAASAAGSATPTAAAGPSIPAPAVALPGERPAAPPAAAHAPPAPAAQPAPSAPSAAPPASAQTLASSQTPSSAQTDVSALAREWDESVALVERYQANKPRGDLGAQCRQVRRSTPSKAQRLFFLGRGTGSDRSRAPCLPPSPSLSP
jgi:chemotaxis protein histidine kinase CheA